MRKFYSIAIWCVGFIMLLACETKQKPIVNTEDYASQLRSFGSIQLAKLNNNQQAIEFWSKKLKQVPNSIIYRQKLAQLFHRRFKLSGEDRFLEKTLDKLKEIAAYQQQEAAYNLVMARYAMERHLFNEGFAYAQKARDIGDQPFASSLLLCDYYLEKGQPDKAKALLATCKQKTYVDYLVRQARIEDQEGNLEGALSIMEKAIKRAELKNDPGLLAWTLTEAGRYYTHHQQYEKGYELFIRAITVSPGYIPAYDAIAWMSFSHDQNPKKAKAIYLEVGKYYHSPDMDLTLAEIARFEQDRQQSKQYSNAFMKAASNSPFPELYLSHQAFILSDWQNQPEKAIHLAKQDLENRSSIKAFDLLAWCYLKAGKAEKAKAVFDRNVLGKSQEPMTLYHHGLIAKANQQPQLAHAQLEEALKGAYELGPEVTEIIKDELLELKASL